MNKIFNKDRNNAPHDTVLFTKLYNMLDKDVSKIRVGGPTLLPWILDRTTKIIFLLSICRQKK